MTHSYLQDLSQEISEFELFLKDYLAKRFDEKSNPEKGLSELRKSIQYTLFSSCKRFRPALAISVCQTLGVDYKLCFPLAAALEMIHTASLIHDDLPCMDDDSQRRGKASNHIIFNEDMALLAGDSLLIEAFVLLCHFNQKSSVIKVIASASSLSGMMGGQALDLRVQEPIQESYLSKLHQMKTGTLIQACVEGCLFLGSHEEQRHQELKSFAYYLGKAFQLADDLEDSHSNEKSNMLNVLDKDQIFQQLDELTKKSLQIIKGQSLLEKAVLFNQARVCID